MIEFTQIRKVLKTIRQGRLVWKAIAQQRPSLKTRVKGTVDYHSNEIAHEAAIQGASGLNKEATLVKHLLKRESWTTALSLTE